MQPSVLITGATGLLGRACLPHLINRHGSHAMLALVRGSSDIRQLRSKGVATLSGDIAEPELGLTREQYTELARSLQFIVHCAADIRFNISLEESRRTNVHGTENLIQLALQCADLKKFAHISTVYVSGGRTGHIFEQAAQPGTFFNPYQQSKFEAEEAVLRAMDRIPAGIYRFSTMIYNQTLSQVEQFNYFHQLLRLALSNPLHMVPADPNAMIDLIVSDWAAHIFDLMFGEHFVPGEIVHICAGRRGSLTVGELFGITFDCLPVSGRRPRIVDQHYFEEHARTLLSTASRRRMWQNLSQFVPHMNLHQTFDTAKIEKALSAGAGERLPDMRSIYSKVLQHCLSTSWGAHEPRDAGQPTEK